MVFLIFSLYIGKGMGFKVFAASALISSSVYNHG